MINSLILAVTVPFMAPHGFIGPDWEATTNLYGSVTGIVDKAYISDMGFETNAYSKTEVDTMLESSTNKVYWTDKKDMTSKAAKNVKWAIISSTRKIIDNIKNERIYRIQLDGGWNGSRGYQCKLLVWINNGSDLSDESTKVSSISDNISIECNKDRSIIFDFSNGIVLPDEQSRIIISVCESTKEWADVRDKKWSEIQTTYPSNGKGMRWLCGTVNDTGCCTYEEDNSTNVNRCVDALFYSGMTNYTTDKYIYNCIYLKDIATQEIYSLIISNGVLRVTN